MTSVEYVQLKAFARVDGVLLALLWAGSFACYLIGLSNPSWSATALLMAVSTPLFAAWRLRSFRNTVLNGGISFLRGWFFVVLLFFYAGLLFAIAQYGYLAYMDHGYLMRMLQQMLESPESQQLIVQYGMGDMMNESVQQLLAMRPIDLVLNMLTTNIMMGFIMGMPIAALMMKKVKK